MAHRMAETNNAKRRRWLLRTEGRKDRGRCGGGPLKRFAAYNRLKSSQKPGGGRPRKRLHTAIMTFVPGPHGNRGNKQLRDPKVDHPQRDAGEVDPRIHPSHLMELNLSPGRAMYLSFRAGKCVYQPNHRRLENWVQSRPLDEVQHLAGSLREERMNGLSDDGNPSGENPLTLKPINPDLDT